MLYNVDNEMGELQDILLRYAGCWLVPNKSTSVGGICQWKKLFFKKYHPTTFKIKSEMWVFMRNVRGSLLLSFWSL